MASEKITARAHVKLEINIIMRDHWSPTATAEQIFRQARESALRQLADFLKPNAWIVVTGEPVVTAIFVDEKEK